MKFYAVIRHPTEKKVLWHYFLEASDKQAASEAVAKRIASEHADGFLLDTGGAYILTIKEDDGNVARDCNSIPSPSQTTGPQRSLP